MALVFAYLVVTPFFEEPLQTLYCVLFLFAGIPFYLVFVRYKVAPPNFLRFVGELPLAGSMFSRFCPFSSPETALLWSETRIATSGPVQHRKSAIHRFAIKSDKSDWLRIRNKNSEPPRGLPRGRDSWC